MEKTRYTFHAHCTVANPAFKKSTKNIRGTITVRLGALDKGLPEVVDSGIAEGQQDGVEGEALDRSFLIRAQSISTHAGTGQYSKYSTAGWSRGGGTGQILPHQGSEH